MSKKSFNKEIGHIGESIACEYLQQQGFVILERNYQKPWVEIDIIARKSEVVHFVEVKASSFASKADLDRSNEAGYRLEELIHAKKLHQLRKGVETWLIENPAVQEVQVDAAMVKVVPTEKFATVKVIEGVL